MKRRKIKLFASVASFALVAAVMSFGVFAATAHTVGVTSTVNFTATGISGSISGVVSNNADENPTLAYYTSNNTVEGTAISFDGTIPEALTDWNITTPIAFADEATAITYTFTIQNTGLVNINASFDSVVLGDENLSYTVSYAGEAYEEIGNEGGAITLTVSVVDAAQKIDNASVNFTVSLQPGSAIE